MSGISKKVQVSVSLPHNLFVEIEKFNNGQSRSELIRGLLEKSLKEEEKNKKNGVVYTPQYLAEYLSSKISSYKKINVTSIIQDEICVLDPACGDGALLQAIKRAFSAAGAINNSPVSYVGVDIDKKALKKANENIGSDFQSVHTNALCPFNSNRFQGWAKINENLNNKNGFDYIIANPPWGADISSYRKFMERDNFHMYQGQYDTSDLFIELSVSLLKENGIAGFIIPDSIFAQERAILRKFILDNTKLLFVGRFGEKIFKDVNRACAIIIFQKVNVISKPYEVDCFRLPSSEKNKIISGINTLESVEKNYKHKVISSRFSIGPDYLFNLDIDSTLESSYQKIASHKGRIGDFLYNYRGVELSKKGKINKCDNCSNWGPASKSDFFICKKCGAKQKTVNSTSKVVIHKSYDNGFNPLIVGENIHRYRIDYDLWIDTSNSGINYKNPDIYDGDKIVVRKTGIGVSASIDYTSSYTNQVVYIFKLKEKFENDIQLEFLLAILNSRAIFFFVAMSNGEIEWKSHPYLTQKQIMNIPIPDFSDFDKNLIEEISEISKIIKSFVKNQDSLPRSVDARLEKIVATIYGLSIEDYHAIFKAIDKAQELLSVKALKNITIEEIFGIED